MIGYLNSRDGVNGHTGSVFAYESVILNDMKPREVPITMDRISALRNIEESLRAFETGNSDLTTVEQRVIGVLRTYAAELESTSSELCAYEASGTQQVAGLIVVAASELKAREQIATLLNIDPSELSDQVNITPI
jgi:hypothetical protein